MNRDTISLQQIDFIYEQITEMYNVYILYFHFIVKLIENKEIIADNNEFISVLFRSLINYFLSLLCRIKLNSKNQFNVHQLMNGIIKNQTELPVNTVYLDLVKKFHKKLKGFGDQWLKELRDTFLMHFDEKISKSKDELKVILSKIDDDKLADLIKLLKKIGELIYTIKNNKPIDEFIKNCSYWEDLRAQDNSQIRGLHNFFGNYNPSKS